jgi:hypothetical protein
MRNQNHTRIMTLAAALVVVSLTLTARQAVAAAGTPVQIVITVEPKHGNEVPLIRQDEIVVHQGHSVRPVTGWVPATGDRAGLALAILIDDSSGISLGPQLEDIRAFLQQQAPTTLVAVGYMQNGTVFMTQDFTRDHAAAARSVRLTQGYWGADASPYTALSDFVKRLPADPAIPRREVLMISSGIDPLYMGVYQDPYVDTAVHDAQCAGVVVYSIYTPSAGHFGHSFWRTYWGQNYLSQVSEETGGESYYFLGPQAPVSFSPYLDKLNHQLASQFLLTFLAEPRKKAGTEPVKITSEIHSVDLLYQDQVCVPATPE